MMRLVLVLSLVALAGCNYPTAPSPVSTQAYDVFAAPVPAPTAPPPAPAPTPDPVIIFVPVPAPPVPAPAPPPAADPVTMYVSVNSPANGVIDLATATLSRVDHYVWEFGDGATQTTLAPFVRHAYANGEYRARVTAISESGAVLGRGSAVVRLG